MTGQVDQCRLLESSLRQLLALMCPQQTGIDWARMGCLYPPVLLLFLIQVKNAVALKKSLSLKNV